MISLTIQSFWLITKAEGRQLPYEVSPLALPFFFGGEQGIRTLEAVLATYTISNRAPSASSDNSPYLIELCYYTQRFGENQDFREI